MARAITVVVPVYNGESSLQKLCGRLTEVLDRFADSKLITIHRAGAESCPAEGLNKYGEVVEHTAASTRLKVRRDRVIPVCKALLDELPVTDIDIQEIPIEDIIRTIFTSPQKA